MSSVAGKISEKIHMPAMIMMTMSSLDVHLHICASHLRTGVSELINQSDTEYFQCVDCSCCSLQQAFKLLFQAEVFLIVLIVR